MDAVRLVVYSDNGDDGAEDLLSRDPGSGGLSGQHRGLVEPARQVERRRSPAARHDRRTVLDGVRDERLHP